MERHLLPDEIDQLLDGEAGFGTAPLKAHIRNCAECRAELDGARLLVRELDRLPLIAPSAHFSDNVMSKVAVFVPWHVALRNTVRGWLPQTSSGRTAAAFGLGSAAVVLTVASLWVISQLDTVVFALNLGVQQVRNAVFDSVIGSLTGVVSEPALNALRAGGLFGLTVITLLLIAVAAGAARAVRALASGARSR